MAGLSPPAQKPRRRRASRVEVEPRRRYFRASPSTDQRDRTPPTPGAPVTPSVQVSPARGPNSANRVVSVTRLTEAEQDRPVLRQPGTPRAAARARTAGPASRPP